MPSTPALLVSPQIGKGKGKAAAQVYACPADGIEQNNDKNKAAPEASTTSQDNTVIPEAAGPAPLAPATTNTTNVNSVMTPAQVKTTNESTETGTMEMSTQAPGETTHTLEGTIATTEAETSTCTQPPGQTNHTLESDTLTVNNSNTMEATPAAAPAKPASLRERLVNLTNQGVDLLTKPLEVAVKKMEETKIKIVERCKVFSATPAVSGSGRKVGEGQGSAAAAVVAAAAALPLTETATGAVSAKSIRGFWARKARWATKRSREAQDKVKGCVTSARQGAQAKLQALKQRCSRKGNKKE